MLNALLELLRRRYIAFQMVAVVFWIALELSGYGFGVLDGLFRRPLTNADRSGIGNLLSGAPPPGPIRLSRPERTALQERLTARFAGAPPKHVVLADLKSMYALKPHSLCDWRGSNVASDPKECNQLKEATPLFQALLASMHPKTEALMLEEVRGYKGDAIKIAFFLGRSGKPQILFDLSRVNGEKWNHAKGYLLKAYHGTSLTELALGKEQAWGDRIFLIDDPGRLNPRPGSCGAAGCPALLLLYGYDHQNFRDTEGKLSTQNLVDLTIGGDLEQRFDLFAALLGQKVTVPPALPPVAFEQERFGVTKFETIHLDRKIEAVFGAGAAARVVYSPVAYRVAFGTVLGVALDGKLYTLWNGGPGYAELGTDRFVFDIIENGKTRRLDDVKGGGGVYALPYSGTAGGANVRLEVRKFIDQAGKPWSEFSDFGAVFGPLRTRQ
ncbi:MAG: hypothetical protein ABL907_14085 [Hyphomicrobium sp.]